MNIIYLHTRNPSSLQGLAERRHRQTNLCISLYYCLQASKGESFFFSSLYIFAYLFLSCLNFSHRSCLLASCFFSTPLPYLFLSPYLLLNNSFFPLTLLPIFSACPFTPSLYISNNLSHFFSTPKLFKICFPVVVSIRLVVLVPCFLFSPTRSKQLQYYMITLSDWAFTCYILNVVRFCGENKIQS